MSCWCSRSISACPVDMMSGCHVKAIVPGLLCDCGHRRLAVPLRVLQCFSRACEDIVPRLLLSCRREVAMAKGRMRTGAGCGVVLAALTLMCAACAPMPYQAGRYPGAYAPINPYAFRAPRPEAQTGSAVGRWDNVMLLPEGTIVQVLHVRRAQAGRRGELGGWRHAAHRDRVGAGGACRAAT